MKTRLLQIVSIIIINFNYIMWTLLVHTSPLVFISQICSEFASKLFNIISRGTKNLMICASYALKNILISTLFYNKNLSVHASISILFHIIIYISIVALITNNVVLYINMDIWNVIAKFISIKLGLLKVYWPGWIGLATPRSVYDLKSSVVFGVIWLITIAILFIVYNINYIILIILALILTRAFLLNFVQKHSVEWILRFFVTGLSKSGKIPLQDIIVRMLLNIKPLIFLILKSVVISLLVVMIFRYNVSMLFMGAQAINDNYISNGLILILPLPICSYFINIALKKIKKQTISTEDCYFFNKFVVNSTNVYRITYILFINYIVRNYYYTYMAVLVTIIILVIILTLVCLYVKGKLDKNKSLAHKFSTLWAGSGEFMAIVSAFLALTPAMQDACNRGFADYVNHRGRGSGNTYWKALPFVEGGKYYMEHQKTVNFTWSRDRLMARVNKPELNPIFKDHKLRLEKSPIINMTFNIRFNDNTYNLKRDWQIRPISFFSNDKFYGSVSETRLENLLIVVLIRKDLDRSQFYPSYYLPDNTVVGQGRPCDLTDVLTTKYGIHLPIGKDLRAGYMVFTQGEPLNNNGLVRVWRPALKYLEPEWLKHETRVRDYYKVYDSDMIRRKEFNYKSMVDTIKICAARNAVDDVQEDKKQAVTRGLITNEVRADRVCRHMYLSFLLHGAGVDNDDPDKYVVWDESELGENEYDPDSFNTVEELMRDVNNKKINEYRVLKEAKTLDSPIDRGLRIGARLELSLKSNHITPGKNCQLIFARRNVTKDLSVWIPKDGVWNYFSLAQQGVIEGYQSSCQGLGKFNTEFELPFIEARRKLLDTLATKYNKLEPEMQSLIKTINAVSINRLTFEFIEARPCKERYFGYIAHSEEKPREDDLEIYSIYDSKNDHCVYDIQLKDEYMDVIIPKHDYHFWDNRDEHSIRKLMDYIYQNGDKEHLCYQSDIPNNKKTLKSIDLQDRVGKTTVSDHNKSVKVGEYKVKKDLSDFHQRMIKRRNILWPYKQDRLANLGVAQGIADQEWEDLVFVDPLGSDKRDEYMEALRYDSPGSPDNEHYYSQSPIDWEAQAESSQTQVDFGAQAESSQAQVNSGAQAESRSRKREDVPSARPSKRVRFNANLEVQEISDNTLAEDILMIDVSDTIDWSRILPTKEPKDKDPVEFNNILPAEEPKNLNPIGFNNILPTKQPKGKDIIDFNNILPTEQPKDKDSIYLMDTLYDEDDEDNIFVMESEDEEDVPESIIIEPDGPVLPVIPELSFEEELVRLQNQDCSMMITDEDIWSADV
jgi:hypothetical protein